MPGADGHTNIKNSNQISGSTFNNSPVVAGTRAKVKVSSGAAHADPQVLASIAELRAALDEARASSDRLADETREALELANVRLTAIEEEMRAPKKKRDWSRVTKSMTGIREALTGLSGLTDSVDALWESVQHVVH